MTTDLHDASLPSPDDNLPVLSPTVDDFSAPFGRSHRSISTSRGIVKRRRSKKAKATKFLQNEVEVRFSESNTDIKVCDYYLKHPEGLIQLKKIGTRLKNPKANRSNANRCGYPLQDGEECESTFKRTEHLTRHKLMHTKQRPYVCPAYMLDKDTKKEIVPCYFAAGRKDNFYDHIATHCRTYLKRIPEYKTKGSGRTHGIAPSEIQEIIFDWMGKDVTKTLEVLERVWRRVEKHIPDLDPSIHGFSMRIDSEIDREG
ncbi:hydrogen peroxide stress regulator 1 [Sphaceloma murrayae]|uniref:Hydrogen peroxide stress regulator 1 n=1 Tax=Sphaceloma murrayae TaxID=2082308 RepID=A0A2K1QT60_9PEZI|nr:hydrogen peroxide stress regulator 1 [Sphaceloma murrayae]